MSYRFRIAAWMVLSCTLIIVVMIFAGHQQLEEELREGKKDKTHPDIPGWTLHNSYSEEEIQDILGEMLKEWTLVAVPMVCLSLGAGLLLARRSLRPMHDINRQLGEMRPNSLHGGITIPEADPVIADLASRLNTLLDRAGIAYQEMAEFSARVAHELRTPLMLLRLRLEHAPPGTPPAFQEEMQDEIARLSRFVERSLLAAKAEQGGLVPVASSLSLSDLVRDVADAYQLLAAERSLAMTLEIAENIRIDADSDLLRQALHGLLENAVRYAKSRILVSCRTENGESVLEIRNDTDPATMATAGLGLGLRLVRGISEASGFDFELRQAEGDFIARMRFET
jgi:signal transduction histidine kinase